MFFLLTIQTAYQISFTNVHCIFRTLLSKKYNSIVWPIVHHCVQWGMDKYDFFILSNNLVTWTGLLYIFSNCVVMNQFLLIAPNFLNFKGKVSEGGWCKLSKDFYSCWENCSRFILKKNRWWQNSLIKLLLIAE